MNAALSAAPRAPFADRAILAVLRRHWVPVQRLAPDSRLTDVVQDPIERNEIFCELEHLFRVELDDRELARLATLGELLTYVGRVTHRARH